ncbi:MAG: hypothetical protein H6564_04870 [Lewinellaceae bacterium]|nr:hypothetical protein [Lewinellaceae bacterium]
MKTLFVHFSLRSPYTFAIALLFAAGALLTSCNKNDDEPGQENLITEDDALDVIEGAMIVPSEGLGAEVESAIYLADEYAEKTITGNPCGETFDSTTMRSVNYPNLTASYTSTWEWTVICNNANIPSALDLSRTAAGTYETARLLSDDSAGSTLNVSNLILGDNYVINGGYGRQGSQESKVRNHSAFSSLLTVDVTDLNVDKGTHSIQSGAATFTLTLTLSGPQSGSQTFEGSIVFNGGGSATITINGNSYTVDWF